MSARLVDPIASPLSRAFSASGAQVVLVKQYTTVEIAAAGAISATRWDGFSGGVIAILPRLPVSRVGLPGVSLSFPHEHLRS